MLFIIIIMSFLIHYIIALSMKNIVSAASKLPKKIMLPLILSTAITTNVQANGVLALCAGGPAPCLVAGGITLLLAGVAYKGSIMRSGDDHYMVPYNDPENPIILPGFQPHYLPNGSTITVPSGPVFPSYTEGSPATPSTPWNTTTPIAPVPHYGTTTVPTNVPNHIAYNEKLEITDIVFPEQSDRDELDAVRNNGGGEIKYILYGSGILKIISIGKMHKDQPRRGVLLQGYIHFNVLGKIKEVGSDMDTYKPDGSEEEKQRNKWKETVKKAVNALQ